MSRKLIGHLVDWRDDATPANGVHNDIFALAGVDHPKTLAWGAPESIRVPVMMDPADGTTPQAITMTNCAFDGSQGNGKRIESGATGTLPRREAVAIVAAGGGNYA